MMSDYATTKLRDYEQNETICEEPTNINIKAGLKETAIIIHECLLAFEAICVALYDGSPNRTPERKEPNCIAGLVLDNHDQAEMLMRGLTELARRLDANDALTKEGR